MRIVLLVLALAAALAVGTLDSTAGSTKRKCTREGTIISYLRTVRRTPCGTALVGAAPLFRGERVRTGELGQLTFQTNHLTLCRIEGKGDLTFLPNPSAAVRLDAGRLWCQQEPGVPARLLTKRGVIKITGTLFGIEATAGQTIVKVEEGSLVVLARSGLGAPAEVGGGSQVTVRKGEEPDPVEGFEPTPEDQQAMTALTLDAPETTLEQARAAIVKAGAAVGVIAETAALQRTESKLSSTKVSFLGWSSVDTFLADENATARLPEAGVKVVVLVGSLDTLAPAIERLRTDLGTEIQIFVLPAAQVSP